MLSSYFISPILNGASLILSASVYNFFKKLKKIGISLLLIAIGRTLAFVGENFFIIYSSNNLYPVLISIGITCYLFDSLCSFFVYCPFLKRWIGIKSIRKEYLGFIFNRRK